LWPDRLRPDHLCSAVHKAATTQIPSDQPRARLALMDPPCAIEADTVSRAFGDQEVLSRVSLAVPAGEIHAVLGRNGAGKTTLIRILSGLTTPTDGAVRLLGEDASGNPRALRGRVGLVPSGDRSFYLRLSGLENLLFFARLHGMRKRAARRRAGETLAMVGLEDAARQRVGHYSHGMQKRLSIARALLTTPPVSARRRGDARPRPARRRGGARTRARTGRPRNGNDLGDAADRGASRLCRRGDGPARGRDRVSSAVSRRLPTRSPSVVTSCALLRRTGPAQASCAPRWQDTAPSRSWTKLRATFRLTLAPDAVLGDAVAALTPRERR
jgi:ABC-type transport system involved in cytochrome c biogenesis ATPase subunit